MKTPPTTTKTSPEKPRNKGGRPKGVKNKATQLREATQLKTLETAAAAKVTPLDAMLLILGDAMDGWSQARQALDQIRKEATVLLRDDALDGGTRKQILERLYLRESQLQAQEGRVSEFARNAAPYCHAKLQQIDGKQTGPLTIVIDQFARIVAPEGKT